MEVLAGKHDMMATIKESKCIFKFDYSKVYWNSRLQTEHERICKMFVETDWIADIFAGVGPFSIPAAKNAHCNVLANDLNPESFKYLQSNSSFNKTDDLVSCFNMDGRQFIRSSVDLANDMGIREKMHKKACEKILAANRKNGKNDAMPGLDTSFRYCTHYLMNLPKTALEFLDAFQGLFAGHESRISADKLPMIHCHLFSGEVDKKADAIKRAETCIGGEIAVATVHNVRNVSPRKDMMCVSFRLPASIAFHTLKRKTSVE